MVQTYIFTYHFKYLFKKIILSTNEYLLICLNIQFMTFFISKFDIFRVKRVKKWLVYLMFQTTMDKKSYAYRSISQLLQYYIPFFRFFELKAHSYLIKKNEIHIISPIYKLFFKIKQIYYNIVRCFLKFQTR